MDGDAARCGNRVQRWPLCEWKGERFTSLKVQLGKEKRRKGYSPKRPKKMDGDAPRCGNRVQRWPLSGY